MSQISSLDYHPPPAPQSLVDPSPNRKRIFLKNPNDPARVHRCPYIGCIYAATKISNLERHKTTHLGLKPFKCDWSGCKTRFSRAANLRRHALTHTNDRPFSCSYCGARFTQESHVKVHFNTHTGARPFTCDLCGLSFT